MRKIAVFLAVLLSLALIAGCGRPAQQPQQPQPAPQQPTPQPAPAPKPPDPVKLRVSTHWGEGFKEKLLPYMEEYTRLNPHVTFEYESVPFEEYLKKVQVQHASGDAPDIYHLYSLWGVQLSRSKVIAELPGDVANFVKGDYTGAAVGGVTIDGKLWGVPTEINNYLLLYNKKLLQEAGFSGPPKTWEELYNMAKAITKKKADGSYERVGIAFMRGWDSAVVHPWMSLLFTEGGRFLTPDNKAAAFNTPEGIAALEFQVRLMKEGLTDPSVNFWAMFPGEQLAMIIMAPWWEDGLKGAMGDNFKNVGVAPVPVGKSGKPATVAYSWFWAVAQPSKNKEEAWKFLHWLNSAQQGQKGSRMGAYLTSVGIIPGRTADMEAYPERLNDDFTKPFIDALAHTTPEPNIPQGQEVKTALMREIEEAWFGRKSPAEALKAAEEQINKILKEAE
jgi:multiple sugar transport system substrate-binding protein